MKKKNEALSCILDPDSALLKCKDERGEWKSFPLQKNDLSEKSLSVKDQKMMILKDIIKSCKKDEKCNKEITLDVFKLESCPACKAHERVITNVKQFFSDAGLPINVNLRNVRNKRYLKEFKDLGCNGTPCTSLKIGSNEPEKIYEGNKQELGVLSDIMGIPNPLYFKTKPGQLPTRLMVK